MMSFADTCVFQRGRNIDLRGVENEVCKTVNEVQNEVHALNEVDVREDHFESKWRA